MKSMQESEIKHNAAWRAFWIRIRELNVRQTDRRCEEIGEQDDHVPAVATDEGSDLSMVTGDKKHR